MREDPLSGAVLRRGPQDQQVVHLRISDQGQLLTLRPPPDTDAGGPASSMHSGLPPLPLPQLLVNDQHQQEPLGIRSPHPQAPQGTGFFWLIAWGCKKAYHLLGGFQASINRCSAQVQREFL